MLRTLHLFSSPAQKNVVRRAVRRRRMLDGKRKVASPVVAGARGSPVQMEIRGTLQALQISGEPSISKNPLSSRDDNPVTKR